MASVSSLASTTWRVRQSISNSAIVWLFTSESHLGPILLCQIDNAEENGNADAVHEFSVAEINDQRPTTRRKLPTAFFVQFFARQFAEVVAAPYAPAVVPTQCDLTVDFVISIR